MPSASPFLFTTCQVGAEPVLKAEIAREHPELRFAYSRPGFVTFKRADGGSFGLDLELRSVFARAYGLSFGKGKDASALIEAARKLQSDESGTGPGRESLPPLRLQVFERDLHVPGEEPQGFVPGERALLWKKKILTAAREVGFDGFRTDGEDSREAELVLDCAVVEENEIWWGAHRQSVRHAPWPGGRFPKGTTHEVPSRAYHKLEEALAWSQAPIRSGDWAVEIGSAPGGASLALLERGINVVGIDPARMDPRVMDYQGAAEFHHIPRPVATVPREELPDAVDWCLLDMNVEPRISLYSVDRLCTRMIDTLSGVFLTVKLNQWKLASEIPDWLEHIKAIGMQRVKARQLSTNRQEILIYGLTRKGLARISTGKKG